MKFSAIMVHFQSSHWILCWFIAIGRYFHLDCLCKFMQNSELPLISFEHRTVETVMLTNI